MPASIETPQSLPVSDDELMTTCMGGGGEEEGKVDHFLLLFQCSPEDIPSRLINFSNSFLPIQPTYKFFHVSQKFITKNIHIGVKICFDPSPDRLARF